MNRTMMWALVSCVGLGGVAGVTVNTTATEEETDVTERANARRDLGRFSLSLAVADLARSRDFYQALGFDIVPGEDFGNDAYGQNWLIMQRDQTVIGLFQGMFERNTLTFNPPDVRALQAELEARGMTLDLKADPNTTGPAFATLTDPDGNPVLLDQH